MYSIICALVVGSLTAIVLFTRYLKKCRVTKKHLEPFDIFSAVGAPLAASIVCGMLLAFVVEISMPHKRIEIGPDVIVGMRSGDNLSGNFIFGSGGIRGGMTYHFYVRNDDNTVSPRQLPASTLVKIDQDASLQGIGYWTTIKLGKDTSHWLYNWASDEFPDEVIEQRLRVPAGTVALSFNSK